MAKLLLSFLACWLSIALPALAQPANDNCSAPADIVLPAAGFGLGTFTAPVDLNGATTQAGEYFAFPSISGKSVWFRFVLPTARRGKIQYLDTRGLTQEGNKISITTYLVDPASPCLPGAGERAAAKLTAVDNYGDAENVCLSPGTYLVQLSTASDVTNTFLQVRLEFREPEVATGAPAYDKPANAANLGTLATQPTATTSLIYNIGCHTIDDASEQACAAVPNAADFTQSTWHTFTTGSYLDYLSLLTDGIPTTEPVLFRLYEGRCPHQLCRTGIRGHLRSAALGVQPVQDQKFPVRNHPPGHYLYFATPFPAGLFPRRCGRDRAPSGHSRLSRAPARAVQPASGQRGHIGQRSQ
jgi:hypothetical protein